MGNRKKLLKSLKDYHKNLCKDYDGHETAIVELEKRIMWVEKEQRHLSKKNLKNLEYLGLD